MNEVELKGFAASNTGNTRFIVQKCFQNRNFLLLIELFIDILEDRDSLRSFNTSDTVNTFKIRLNRR